MTKDKFIVINIFIEKDKTKIKEIVNEKMSRVINKLEAKKKTDKVIE